MEPALTQEGKQTGRGIWVLGAALALLAWLLIGQRSELKKLAAVLAQGQWEWVLAAAVLQVLFYVSYTALYQSAFAVVGVRSRVRDLLAPIFQAVLVDVPAPGAGVGLIIHAVVQRGQSLAGAAAGAILVRVTDFGTFVVLLLAALVHLFLVRHLKSYEVLASAILLSTTTAWALSLVFGLLRPRWLRVSLEALQRAVNRVAGWFRRRPVLAADWPERMAGDFAAAAAAVAHDPKGLVRTTGVALGAHAVDILSLYTLFLAFHQPVAFGTLVTGFSIGILFWVVSITPQGIGVVEGMMTLVFAQLGVPIERAAVISLAFRGLTFWLPLLIGFALIHSVRFGPAPEGAETAPGTPHETRPGFRRGTGAAAVHLLALLTVGMAAVNLLSAVQPALRERLHALAPFLPLVVRQGARLTAAIAGFALLLLALGLWRRKHLAWWLTMVTLAVSIVSHLLKGLDYEEASLAAALMLALFVLRAHFSARSDAPSVAQGLRVLALAALFTLAYGVSGFYLLDRHFRVDFGLLAAVRQTILMFAEFTNPGLEPITGFGRFFADSIYLVAAATFGYAVYMLLRPVLLRRAPTPDEQARAEHIVEAHGRSSLARIALLPDKTFFFSPGGSVIAYVTKGRIALALGDPIGPPQDLGPAIAAFRAFCSRNDWQPAFYQTLPDTVPAYRAAGFSVLRIGDEAIVDLSAFTLEGGAYKALRTAANRLTRLGYQAEMLEPPLSQASLEELWSVSSEWLATAKGTEKGFSLGWFDEGYIGASLVMVIRDPEGATVAFANMVPEYQRNEVTIDLMRRRRETPGGTMDFLFASLLLWAREHGYETFNLGMSPLAGVGQTAQDPAVERALHFIYEHLNQFYSFQGLHAYKEKFRPAWSPRYLIYPGLPSLAGVAVAILRADAGDEFVWDSLRDLAVQRLPSAGREALRTL